MVSKVVLAYPGPDTSIIIPWLKENSITRQLRSALTQVKEPIEL